MYVLAGHSGSGCQSAHYRIKATGSSWEGRTGYPRVIHRHSAVVDPVKERIYVFGGHDCSYSRAEAYYYSPSSNQWHQISNLPWAAYDIAAAIVTQKNEERWLLVARSGHSDMYYWNLNTESGYHYMVFYLVILPVWTYYLGRRNPQTRRQDGHDLPDSVHRLHGGRLHGQRRKEEHQLLGLQPGADEV